MTSPSEEQQAEYNKFVGFYGELHEAVDSLASEYNSILMMRGPFKWTDEMALDCREAITIVEDFRAKLHKVFLVNGIEQAQIDQNKWAEELAKLTKGMGTEPNSDDFIDGGPVIGVCICPELTDLPEVRSDCPVHGWISFT